MSNKIKALGLALFAAFAMSAVAASAASAEEFHSEVEHTILMSKSIGNQVFTVDSGELECKKVSLNEPESTIGPEASTTDEVTVTPEYSECVKKGTSTQLFPDFAANECDYRFTSETDATEHAQVHIECAGEETEGGQGVIITATIFHLNCVDVPPQTVGGQGNGSGVHYTNTGAGAGRTIDVEATISEEIHYTQTGVCSTSGDPETYFNGSYTGTVEVEGTDTEEEQVGIWKG
jgi:hypothetical protein